MRHSWRGRSVNLLVVQNFIQILFTDTSKTHKCGHAATKVQEAGGASPPLVETQGMVRLTMALSIYLRTVSAHYCFPSDSSFGDHPASITMWNINKLLFFFLTQWCYAENAKHLSARPLTPYTSCVLGCHGIRVQLILCRWIRSLCSLQDFAINSLVTTLLSLARA